MSASAVFERASGYADFTKLDEPVLKVGVEYGGPRGVVRPLVSPSRYRAHPVLQKPQNVEHILANCIETGLILQNSGVQDIAAFQNTIHQSFAPKLYKYTENASDLIYKYDENLRREFEGIFPTAEFDLGELGSAPRLQDRDLIQGWRALTALGTYNSHFGGDLVLWDDGWIIRFPPGATILFPAALMRYSFVDVLPGEKQYTFSQYSPAGLYRYILNGYRSDGHFERSAEKREMETRNRARGRRLEAAVKMYSTLNEFINT
ncbi:hypothetical protein DFH06DRAFT_1011593 [Mycena polygramma]|nr:hypothetical protein C8R47DRAFT_986718 [Mycena vitilis]KAJ6493717.1 hypothetical protein C8R47DRAFT_975146 [Mycena vitilis]KAJ7618970.1 hypothetical protein DFH06DRAFT_1011593 [Mycena polygramma]